MPAAALVLTHEPPLPAISGTRVRPLNLMRQLAERDWRLSLFALGFGALPGPEELSELESMCERVVIPRFARSRPRRYARIGLDLVRGRAFQESYFYSRDAANELDALLSSQPFEVLLVDQLYMYPYVSERLHKATVLDCHNVELTRIQTMAATLGSRPRGMMARMQLGAVERFESAAVQ